MRKFSSKFCEGKKRKKKIEKQLITKLGTGENVEKYRDYVGTEGIRKTF